MTKLIWDRSDQRKYETGVDKGVLYPLSGLGVVWNGLINVEESYVGGESNPLYYDGIKQLDFVMYKIYKAKLSAFSAPGEFSACLGDLSVVPGFILTRQPRQMFGLTYRTRIGDGTFYKLHLVYNATASIESRSYTTVGSNVAPAVLSWNVDAVPTKHQGIRPTSHYILDSTRVRASTLVAIENIVYGTASTTPRMPTVSELLTL